MSRYMTISDAVEAFDLYGVFNELLDTYEPEFYARSEMETDLRDLIEEHEETYEFTPDEDGEYAESLERNLREALGIIFEEQGMDDFFDDEFADEAMDDEDIEGIYSDNLEDDPLVEDPVDEDEEIGLDDEDARLY